MSEDFIQFEVIKWFQNTYCRTDCSPRGLIFSVPNGGMRSKIEAIKLKATGLTPGVSDLIVIYDQKILFLELKKDKGRLSDAQKIFASRIEANGFDYAVAYSVDQAKEIILNKLFGIENQANND